MFEAIFAVQVTFFFNEANVDEFSFAAWIYAEEMSWTPCFTQSSDEWSSVMDGKGSSVNLLSLYVVKIVIDQTWCCTTEATTMQTYTYLVILHLHLSQTGCSPLARPLAIFVTSGLSSTGSFSGGGGISLLFFSM